MPAFRARPAHARQDWLARVAEALGSTARRLAVPRRQSGARGDPLYIARGNCPRSPRARPDESRATLRVSAHTAAAGGKGSGDCGPGCLTWGRRTRVCSYAWRSELRESGASQRPRGSASAKTKRTRIGSAARRGLCGRPADAARPRVETWTPGSSCVGRCRCRASDDGQADVRTLCETLRTAPAQLRAEWTPGGGGAAVPR